MLKKGVLLLGYCLKPKKRNKFGLKLNHYNLKYLLLTKVTQNNIPTWITQVLQECTIIVSVGDTEASTLTKYVSVLHSHTASVSFVLFSHTFSVCVCWEEKGGGILQLLVGTCSYAAPHSPQSPSSSFSSFILAFSLFSLSDCGPHIHTATRSEERHGVRTPDLCSHQTNFSLLCIYTFPQTRATKSCIFWGSEESFVFYNDLLMRVFWRTRGEKR